MKYGWEKVSNWDCLFVHREKGLFLSVFVDDIKLAGKKQNINLMWEVLNKEVDLGEQTSFFDHVYLGCTQCKEEELKSVGDLSQVCSQMVLKCLYLARAGRPDILWSVNKLARSITKWTKACDKRLNRLISYIHHTSEHKQILSCGKHCQTMQTGTDSRLRFCRRS